MNKGIAQIALAAVAASVLLLGGCGDQRSEEPLRVFAAASMADVLPDLARDFEKDHAVQVEFSFDGTSRVARQLESGAPADVFVSANRDWMEYLASRDAIAPPSRRTFAGNRLVWVEPMSVSTEISSPKQISADRVDRLALANVEVPAGRYAEQALRDHGVYDALQPHVVRAPHVRAVLEWVSRGEVGAGITYRTDVMGRDGVRAAFAFPAESHDPISYEAAKTADSNHPAASEFVAFLASESARDTLERYGFEPPPGDVTTSAPARPDKIDIWTPIRLSLMVGLLAVLLGLLPAIGLGWLLARRDFFGKSLVSTLILAPLAMPPVVTGFLLLELFGKRGLVGGWLYELGLQVPFSRVGAILAAFTVGLPLFVLAARNAFEQVDTVLEDVARSLGETQFGAFRRVTLPLAWPGLAAGATLMFARAVGEFGATAVLAGNLEGETRTLALAVYTLLETPGGRSELWWLVGGAIGLSFAAVLGYEWLTRWQRRRCGGER
ncbi:MAG: molybdate ABC transporter permease subunit [Myxococcota bacterium]